MRMWFCSRLQSSFCVCLGIMYLGHMIVLLIVFWESSRPLSEGIRLVSTPTDNMGGFPFSLSTLALACICIHNDALLTGERESYSIFNLNFPEGLGSCTIFRCLMDICIFPFKNSLFSSTVRQSIYTYYSKFCVCACMGAYILED